MRYAYITGTGSGIGRALAERLLSEGWRVTGFSRSAGPVHAHYTHVQVDLSNEAAVMNVAFAPHPDAERIVLVNNAGMLGHIAHTAAADPAQQATLFRLNVTAPVLLTGAFLRAYQNHKAAQVILNVSSGAGKNPVDGWGAYCASKAALDMHTRVVDAELRMDGRTHIRIFSVAPGVVDTPMQAQIRGSVISDFSRAEEFKQLYHTGQLLSPDEVAARYTFLLNNPEAFEQPVFAAKEIQVNHPHNLISTPIHQ
ncbi:MAG: SDR family NAD(P)-dependent oxidoreductase [Bacteroidetes bacterium]|nr:SDR family NAD(P)-dependent oxidoreductase [Bacteroidota bacterium]